MGTVVPGVLLTHSLSLYTPMVPIQIDKVKAHAVLDSGADVSIMSENMYKRLPNKVKLKSSRLPLTGVSGTQLSSLGSVTTKVLIGHAEISMKFEVLKGITKDALLGSDFLSMTKAKLDYENKTLQIFDHIVILKSKQQIKQECSLVQVNERVKLPAYSETVTCAWLSRRVPSGTYTVTLLDNAPVFIDQPGVLIPNSLVTVNEDRKIPLTLVNTTGQNLVFSPGTIVGYAEHLEEKDILHVNQMEMDCSVSTAMESTDLNTDSKADFLKLFKLNHIPEQKRSQICSLLTKYRSAFALNDLELGTTTTTSLKIDTGDSLPVAQKPYRTPYTLRHELQNQVDNMLEAGIIRPSSSPYASPVILVPKKGGEMRLVIDYRKLNKNIVKNTYPLPNIEDVVINQLGAANLYSVCDLKSGFLHIAINEEDRHKTAFTCFLGLYEFNKMPFGLTVAPSVYQNTMNDLLSGLIGDCVMVYIDDVIVYSKTYEDHLRHLELVFDRLQNAGMKFKPSKCSLFQSKVLYLGHIITPNGSYPDPEKVKVIQNLDPPQTVRDVRSFIGMAGFYRRYVEHFSEIARPLTMLTRKNAKFIWSPEAQTAFDTLKECLMCSPILAYPDVKLPYKLWTDASQYCIGAILTQETDKGDHVIQYVSHALNEGQQKWSTIEREAYAIVYAITKLRPYLYGADFTVICDHKPLKSIFSTQMTNARVQRWAILISEYGCDIQYTSGKSNTRADFLSRIHPGDDQSKTDLQLNVIDSDTPNYTRLINNQPNERPVGSTLPQLANVENIDRLQRQDPSILSIIDSLNNLSDSKYAQEFVLEDGILYHIAEPVRLDCQPRQQLVIPGSLVHTVLTNSHETSGHFGIDKTYDKIRSRYYWKHSYKDVVNHVNRCVTCNTRKLKKKNIELQDMPIPESPFEMIGIDTCGPYVESFSGNRYIVTIVDHYSGWPEAFACKDKSAETVAKILLEEFIPRFACPITMISDNGTEYVNAIIDSLSKELNIHRITCSPYHPQSNGKTERFHRVLKAILAKSLESSDQRNWDLYIPMALSAYRTSVNDSTHFTPHFLVYGRDPVLPMDTLLRPKLRYMGDQYVPTMLARLHESYTVVKENTREAREKNKRYFNQRAERCSYKVGDPVYYFSKASLPGTSSKLNIAWRPYYRIVKQLTPVNFVIRHQLTGQTKSVHAEHLHPAHPDSIWDKERVQPEPICNKSRSLQQRNYEAPTRDQPLRQAKLLVSVPSSTLSQEPDDNVAIQQEHLNPQSDPLSGVPVPSCTGTGHRYDLRPRPSTRPSCVDRQVHGIKRKPGPEIETQGTIVKKGRLDENVDHQLKESPMDISLVNLSNTPDLIILILGIFVGVLFTAIMHAL